jgi:hypothetical protein
MSKLFKPEVNDSWFRVDGLGWWVAFGEARTVDGERHVQMKHAMFPAEGWHENRADAVRAAADRIEQLGHRLLDQAARVRAEADAKTEVEA